MKKDDCSIQISLTLLERIKYIDWLSHCGEAMYAKAAMDCSQVSSFKLAVKNCSSLKWENATLDARNFLSAYLFNNHSQQYRCWNSVALDAKEFIHETVDPQLHHVFGGSLPKACIDSIHWDIHSAIMEDAYSVLNHPFTFFAQLLDIYEAGHFPCGWTGGKYPNGTLLIY